MSSGTGGMPTAPDSCSPDDTNPPGAELWLSRRLGHTRETKIPNLRVYSLIDFLPEESAIPEICWIVIIIVIDVSRI